MSYLVSYVWETELIFLWYLYNGTPTNTSQLPRAGKWPQELLRNGCADLLGLGSKSPSTWLTVSQEMMPGLILPVIWPADPPEEQWGRGVALGLCRTQSIGISAPLCTFVWPTWSLCAVRVILRLTVLRYNLHLLQVSKQNCLSKLHFRSQIAANGLLSSYSQPLRWHLVCAQQDNQPLVPVDHWLLELWRYRSHRFGVRYIKECAIKYNLDTSSSILCLSLDHLQFPILCKCYTVCYAAVLFRK